MSTEKNDQNLEKNSPGVHNGQPSTPEQTVDELQRMPNLARKKIDVLGGVTRHDILNQMTVIMGYNELLSTMVQDEKSLDFLAIQRRASDKIRRILAYSKVFQSIGAEPPKWYAVDMLVKTASDELEANTVAIHMETGTCSLYADLTIAKVFFYLLDNAIRHGKRTTEIRIHLQPGDNHRVLIVEDNGVGIAHEEKEKIFTRGFGKYTGWGLFVTREILAVNDMTIQETGTEGTGARFEIQIPNGRIRTGRGGS
jgi:signal transduction histidine kinase